jgi:hypothetical protein
VLVILSKGSVICDQLNWYLDGITNAKLSLQDERIVPRHDLLREGGARVPRKYFGKALLLGAHPVNEKCPLVFGRRRRHKVLNTPKKRNSDGA